MVFYFIFLFYLALSVLPKTEPKLHSSMSLLFCLCYIDDVIVFTLNVNIWFCQFLGLNCGYHQITFQYPLLTSVRCCAFFCAVYSFLMRAGDIGVSFFFWAISWATRGFLPNPLADLGFFWFVSTNFDDEAAPIFEFRFRLLVLELKHADGQTDRQTDGQTEPD